jgi:hypothetical protein
MKFQQEDLFMSAANDMLNLYEAIKEAESWTETAIGEAGGFLHDGQPWSEMQEAMSILNEVYAKLNTVLAILEPHRKSADEELDYYADLADGQSY